MTPDEARGLEPGFQGNLSNLFSAYSKLDPNVEWRVISGYRTPEQQAGLSGYHADPGNSAHQLGAAVDLAPVVNGQMLSGADAAPYRERLGAMAPDYGVHWGGVWQRPDTPHFQAYPGFQQRNDWISQHQDWLTKQGYRYSGSTSTPASTPTVAPAQPLPATLTGLIAQTANNMGHPELIPKLYGIVAGESLHGNAYDVKNDNIESSWGPFQLNRRAGLGVDFEKDTGLDLRNASTIPAQIRWVTNYLAQGGSLKPWAGYHGDVSTPDPRWGNAGYDPNTAVAAGGGGGGAATGGPQQSGGGGSAAAGAVPYPVQTPGMTIGQELSRLASTSSFTGRGGGGGGGSGIEAAASDQPAIRTPALGAAQSQDINAVPAQYAGGIGAPGSVGSTLGQLAMQQSPATNPLDPGSITSGEGMTQTLGQLGMDASYNYLDPRGVRVPSTSNRMPRLA